MTSDRNAYLSEIFSSIQGEGTWIGLRQIFLRFMGCDLRCNWCDTPDSLTIKKKSSISIRESSLLSSSEKLLRNPVSLEQAIKIILDFDKNNDHHSLSLTGGEPLLQNQFIRALLLELKLKFKESSRRKLKIFLETGGHLPQKLKTVVDLVDFVSFDLKVPSSTQEKKLWEEHQGFIEILEQKKVSSVAKIVITSKTDFGELVYAFKLVKKKKNLGLILQPVNNTKSFQDSEKLGEKLDSYQKEAIKLLGPEKVRIIPQTHKILGIS